MEVSGASGPAPAGLLLVDKPQGWTSHDVVAWVRRRLPRGTRVGHTGTLDPLATGLLVLLVGRATKEAERFLRLPKIYSGRLRLGVETATGDLEGPVVKERPVPPLTAAELERVLRGLTGEVELPVPAFSAVKHQGRPLYAYAREGVAVPAKARRSRVEEFRLTSWEPPEAAFRLCCSSGTYARALAVEAGSRLGCGATLSALRREGVGGFPLAAARTMEELGRVAATGGLLALAVETRTGAHAPG